jgi:hypothetical protein
MKKILNLILCASVFLALACEDKEKTDPEFTLDNDINDNHLGKGFSFSKMGVINLPNSENLIPDFIVACLMDENGNLQGGPFLSHPNLEGRFVFIKDYDNKISAQNHFDTISTISSRPYDIFASNLKPNELWQIKTSTEDIGIILIMEARNENVQGEGYAEIKFKAKKLNP